MLQVGKLFRNLAGSSWGTGSKLEVLEAFLVCILGLVGRQWGFEKLRSHRERVWKGLGWPEGG